MIEHPSAPMSEHAIIAIAASTGGPPALQTVLDALAANYDLPILVTQHMAVGFTEGFVSWLNGKVSVNVKLAEHNEPLKKRTVYIAPEGHHLEVNDDTVFLNSHRPAVDGHRPSATPMFESVAKAFGASTMAITFMGKGRDGEDGLRAVEQAGGRVIRWDLGR